MDDFQESFTRQILRRVSQRRQHDADAASRRRFKILKAIKDAPAPYTSSISISNEYNERSDNSFRDDSFNLTATYSRDDDNNNDVKSINANEQLFCNAINDFSSFDDANDEEETPILVKVTKGHIQVPVKKIAQLKQIEAKTISNPIFHFGLTHVRQSSISDPSRSTQGRTKYLEKRTSALTTTAVVEMCQRVSSILTNIRCDSAEPQFLDEKKCSTITSDEIDSKSFVKDIYDRPIMESTRKSTNSNSNDVKFSSNSTKENTNEEKNDEGEKFLVGTLRADEDRPLRMSMIRASNVSEIETPSRNFGTLDRSMRLYRTLSQRIKRTIRSSVRLESEEDKEIAIIPSGFDEVDRIQTLLREIKIQRTLMNQASKALDLCSNLKQFTESSERVESERILLLASLRGKAALEEIKWITCEDNIEDRKMLSASSSSSERGEVTISEISLDLRECLEQQIQEERVFNEYFVVVVTQGLKVWSTRPISCVVGDKRMNFPGSVSIANLTPGFKIRIEVYSLKLIRRRSEEERCRTQRKLSFKNIFVSPTRLFKKVENSSNSSSVMHRCNSINVKTSNSLFVLCGYTELILEDLSISSPWPLMLVPNNSKLRGTIDLNLACRLHFSSSHEGFLNYGAESGGLATWNRRWCVLRGHTLNFWNYPREQESKEPLQIIQLINCVSNEVTIVDRTICAKPRTLLIETRRAKCPTDRNSILVKCKPECTIVRNLLSYDTVRELNEWSQKLNEIIVALEEWKVIGPESSPANLSNL